jgi:hypothetical protein
MLHAPGWVCTVPISRIADEVDWSHRHLIARFRQQVGLTPKIGAQLVRLDAVLQRIEKRGPLDWGQVDPVRVPSRKPIIQNGFLLRHRGKSSPWAGLTRRAQPSTATREAAARVLAAKTELAD